jgi:hypothetical protein
MHQVLSRDDETISLGMPEAPYWTNHSHGLYTSTLCFPSNMRFSDKLGASASYFLYVKFHFVHVAKTIINIYFL